MLEFIVFAPFRTLGASPRPPGLRRAVGERRLRSLHLRCGLPLLWGGRGGAQGRDCDGGV